MRLIVRVISMQELLAPVGLMAELALAQIPGVSDVRTESEDRDSAVLSYEWRRLGETFQETDAHLLRYHFKRDWNYERASTDPLATQGSGPLWKSATHS